MEFVDGRKYDIVSGDAKLNVIALKTIQALDECLASKSEPNQVSLPGYQKSGTH